MKRFAIILTIVAATAMMFSSCKKYEEGPAFSLATKTARITGIWNISEITVNEDLQDLQGSGIKLELKKDGTGTVTITWGALSFSYPAEWEFDSTKENLKIDVKNESEDFFSDILDELFLMFKETEIIKLTGSELWLRDIETEAGIEYTTITKLNKE